MKDTVFKDFRAAFARLPDDGLMTVAEFGQVAVLPSTAAVRKAIERHPDCMPPVVRLSNGPRAPMRFRVGDVRAWIRSRAGQAVTTAGAGDVPGPDAPTRVGRPRASVDVQGFGSLK